MCENCEAHNTEEESKMDNLSGWGFPDFSKIQAIISGFQEVVRPIFEGVQKFRDALQPFVEAVEEYKPKIVAVSQVFLALGQRLKAVDKLGDAQFVYWEYMSQEFVDDIVAAKNVNATLRQYMIRDKFVKVDETITKTMDSEQMIPFKRLYGQAVDAFRMNKSDLAVLGFTAVFDGFLSEVSEDQTTSLKKRITVIKAKLDDEKDLTRDEIVLITLAMTLERAMDIFAAYSDFEKKEPKGLNRHWIAHGRSRRKKTKLDCVKLINMIYGLVLVSNLEQSKP